MKKLKIYKPPDNTTMMTGDIATGFWVSDNNHISGPRFCMQVRLEGDKIIVPSCDENYSLAHEGDKTHILHNNKPTGFYIDRFCVDAIFGPSRKLPWEDHLAAIKKAKESN